MTTPSHPRYASDPLVTYEIRLSGHLDDRWSARLGARTLVRDDDACTTVTIEVTDQAHLHGLLSRIRDLGLPLLSLTRSGSSEDHHRSHITW